jgi:hypothetical protein
MNFQVVIPESVYEELNDVASYYEQLQENLGVKFLNDWEYTMNQLSASPLMFQKKFKQFRVIQFSRFQFLIIYEIDKLDVVVYRLIHAKRNPNKRFKK